MTDVELDVLYDYLKKSNEYLNDIFETSFDILSASNDIRESAKLIKESMAKQSTGDVDIKNILQQMFGSLSETSKGTGAGIFTEADITKLSQIITVYADSIKQSVGTLTPDTKQLTDSIQAVNIGFLSAFNEKLLKDADNNIKRFFNILKSFVKHLNKFRIKRDISKRAKKSIGYVKSTVKEINKIIKNIKLEEIEKFSGTLLSIAKSITGFVGALGVTGVLAIVATPGLLFFKLALKLLRPEFKYLSKNSQKMKDGAKSLMFVGTGLVAMSLAIVASAYAISKFSITDMVIGIITVIGITYLVSKFYKYMGLSNKVDLKNGIKNVALMSLSLLLMTGTFYLISQVPLDYTKIGMALLLLAGTAMLFTLFGVQAVSKNIMKGTLSVALMSLSLLLFGYSLSHVSTVLDKHTKAIWQIPLMLISVALPFVLAGMVFTQILQGALSFALIGIALWIMKTPLVSVATTLNKYGDAVWKIPVLLTSLGLVFAGAGFLLPFIAGGALAFATIGGALWILAKGLKPIASLEFDTEKTQSFADNLKIIVKGLSDAFSELSVGSMIKISISGGIIANTIGKFATALANWKSKTANWTPDDAQILSDTILGVTTAIALGTSPEYISKKHGVEVSQWQILKGIAFTMSLGANLRQLASGIMAWKNMKLTAEDAMLISDNINTILSVIPATIARIGDNAKVKPATGILGFISKGLWTTTDVERGIDYVKGIGKAMTKLADGVKTWKEMKLTSEDAQLISDNINIVLSVIPATIATIGNSATNEKPSMWGLWTTNDVERGIDYVKGIGKAINNLGEGVKTWRSMKLTASDTKLITSNINSVLAIIPETIAKIGDDTKTAKPGLFGLWKTTDTERGIKYVAGMSKPLKELSESVLNWKKAKLSPSDIKAINKNITDIITTLPSVFAQIGRAKDNDKGFWGLFKSDSEKGIKVVNNLIEPLNGLANVVAKFNSTVDVKERGTQIGLGIRQLLTQTAYGMQAITAHKVDIFSKFIDPFKRFTDIYIKFLKELKNESVDFGGISKLIDSSANFYDKYETANIKKTEASSFSVYTPAPIIAPTASSTKPSQQLDLNQLLTAFTASNNAQQQQIATLIKEVQRLNGKINDLTNGEGRLKTSMNG